MQPLAACTSIYQRNEPSLNRVVFSQPTAFRIWQSIALLLGGCLLWLVNHPYIGFDHHDARIYAVLALRWLTPDAYGRDPFFLFGSQDTYSLFSPLYGSLIALTSLPIAAKIVMLVGGGLWVLAALGLWRRLSRSSILGASALLAMICLSLNFSPNGNTFTLNEGFPTARNWAMPLGALALVAWLGKQRVSGFIVASAACVLHPLLGIWVLAVGILYFVPWRGGILLSLIAALTLVSLVGLQVGPFAPLDPDWLLFLRTYTWDLMLAEEWGGRRDAMAFALLTLGLAGQLSDDAVQRRLYWTIAAVAASGLVIAWFCTHVVASALLVQAQPWRSMWLAFLLLPFAMAQCLSRLWLQDQDVAPWWQRPSALLGLLIVVLLLMFPSTWMLLVCAVPTLMLARSSRLRAGLGKYTHWLLILIIATYVLFLPAYWLELDLLSDEIRIHGIGASTHWSGFLLRGGGGPGFLFAALLLLALARLRQASLLLILPLATVLLSWDGRPVADRARDLAMSSHKRGAVGEHIRPGEVVLWAANKPSSVWYGLGTAHYASPVQATGRVFSREKSEELLRRAAHIRTAVSPQEGQPFHGISAILASAVQEDPFDFPAPTPASIARLCDDPALDWVVLDDRSAESNNGILVRAPDRSRYWSLYRCPH
jgi:hypothetical protein